MTKLPIIYIIIINTLHKRLNYNEIYLVWTMKGKTLKANLQNKNLRIIIRIYN